MIVTTKQAAALVGVTSDAIRQWVHRGYLIPLTATKPLRFAAADVWRVARERMPDTWHKKIEKSADVWRVATTEHETNCHDNPQHPHAENG